MLHSCKPQCRTHASKCSLPRTILTAPALATSCRYAGQSLPCAVEQKWRRRRFLYMYSSPSRNPCYYGKVVHRTIRQLHMVGDTRLCRWGTVPRKGQGCATETMESTEGMSLVTFLVNKKIQVTGIRHTISPHVSTACRAGDTRNIL